VVKGKTENKIKRPAPIAGRLIHSYLNAREPSNTHRTGILIVGHGSRREEANEDVREAARQIGLRGDFPLVEPAFLEITRPTIREGFAALIAQGARHIIVHPYFLSPGRHTRGDIPVEVRAAASLSDAVSYRITEPLAAHRLVIEASIERIREAVDPSTNRNLSSLSQPGKVYLVGAGPGDPGLLTIKAVELLGQADVVVYDYLVNPDVLLRVPADAERIYVGKVGGGCKTKQSEINDLLIARAKQGEIVVRLKGGDPFLFGRGAEEALALRGAGISFEIVPGVSSVASVPAYAGIPLTHRGLSSSVAILTGARAGDGKLSDDLLSARDAGTIVVLMGISHLRQIAAKLIWAGRSQETPVAVIRWGTYEAQQVITGTLSTIADFADAERLRAPSIIVIGDVVRLRESLSWFGKELTETIEWEPAQAAIS